MSRPVEARPHPLASWAGLDLDLGLLESDPSRPPVPTFVHLSRLVEHDVEPTSIRGQVRDVIDLTEAGPSSGSGQQWADSVGRPLFQIGLAALAAAAAVAIFSLTPPSSEPITTVESPKPAVDSGTRSLPGIERFSNHGSGEAVSLSGQGAGLDDADLSIVGTASAGDGVVRWTATVGNSGPRPDPGPISVAHGIPPELDLIRASGTGWSCQAGGAAGPITCTLADALGAEEHRRLTIITTDGGAPAGTRLPTTMSVLGAGHDPDLGNNTISVTGIAFGSSPEADDGSRSTGAASGAATDHDSSGSASSSTDGPATSVGDELPKTGTGLTLTLTAIGIGLCLLGRRLMRWSAPGIVTGEPAANRR